MTRLISYTYDHLSCSAGYGTPDTHSHLALHFIFSLDTAFPGNAGGNDFEGKAVFIDSDVPHTLHLESCDAVVVLFEPLGTLRVVGIRNQPSENSSRNALITTSTEPQLWKSAPHTVFRTPVTARKTAAKFRSMEMQRFSVMRLWVFLAILNR